jgi:hypothetical protein
VCRCGNTGCVEAVASGAALVRALSAAGLPVSTARDVARLAADGNTTARRAVRVAAQQVGEVLVGVVSFHNPGRILLGGLSTAVGDEVLAEIKAVVYTGAYCPWPQGRCASRPARWGPCSDRGSDRARPGTRVTRRRLSPAGRDAKACGGAAGIRPPAVPSGAICLPRAGSSMPGSPCATPSTSKVGDPVMASRAASASPGAQPEQHPSQAARPRRGLTTSAGCEARPDGFIGSHRSGGRCRR